MRLATAVVGDTWLTADDDLPRCDRRAVRGRVGCEVLWPGEAGGEERLVINARETRANAGPNIADCVFT